MPRNGKFLILFNKFFCVQVKVHWLGPIVKWYTLVYESTLWNPYIRGGTYVLRKNWFFFPPPSPPSPHSLSLETTPLEFVDRVGGGEWELRVWWWPKEHGSSRQKYFQEFYGLWIQNLNSWKKNQTCLCYLGAKLFLPWCLKKKLFQLSKISPDLNLIDPLRRRFN